MNLSKQQITDIANSIGLEYAVLRAFIAVESGGSAFNDDGRIIIQFEPAWFIKFAKKEYAVYLKIAAKPIEKQTPDEFKLAHYWQIVTKNKVEGQVPEYNAFNAAFRINQQAALLSTSIGLMQVMGFNYASAGYKSVNDMWDDYRASEYNQVKGAAMFIKNNPNLLKALKTHNWAMAAYYYNGANYAAGKYHVKLANNYKIYSA